MGDSEDHDEDAGAERLDAHLQGIDDGCGCTEVWEHTSAAREGAAAERDDEPADD